MVNAKMFDTKILCSLAKTFSKRTANHPPLCCRCRCAGDKSFQAKWRAVKQAKKAKLAALLKTQFGEDVPVNAMFDIQIKRIHEYKRQYMNVLSIILRYKQLKAMTPAERKNAVPRVCVIGGKVRVT